MTSRSMMRSVSAPAADSAPPVAVALTLRSTPFRSSTTRRDLTTSYRAFKAAWTTIEQVQVLSASCRRLGERAAEVLNAVREKLEAIEQAETTAKAGTVVLERSYEFQRGKDGSETAGTTIFKVQSTMLDLQAFATDHLAKSNASRLTLLVDELSKTKTALAKLSNSLLNCSSIYSLSTTISTSPWSDQDASDLAKDYAALPRLFQLSIMLKGPTYERFTKQRADSPASTETPGQRRAAFVEWCLEQNPILRPGQSGGGGGVQAPLPSTKPLPNSASGIGLGLPSNLSPGAGSASMQRAATQPPSFANRPSVLAESTPVKQPEPEPQPTPEESPLPDKSPSHEASPTPSSPPPPSLDSTPAQLPTDKLDATPAPPQSTPVQGPQETIASESSTSPDLAESSVAPIEISPEPITSKPDDSDPTPSSHALDRSVSTVSSMAMTNSSSMGSILFEPVLPSIEVQEVETTESLGLNEVQGETGTGSDEKSQQVQEEEIEENGGDEIKAETAPSEEETATSTPLGSSDGVLDDILGGYEVTPSPEEPQTVGTDSNSKPEPENSILELALDTPLPLSPQVEQAEATREQEHIVPPRPSSPPAPLELLAALPINDESLPTTDSSLVEPLQTPSPPALPSSPSLLITSVDDEEAEEAAPPSPPPKPSQSFRILSLDGGGLVGPLPQLFALKKYLSSIPDADPAVPSRHFDLIVGTSSSALPALLLGQLGLSIDETLRICAQVSRKAFNLEGTTSSGAKPSKPRRIGRWSRFFNRGARSAPSTPSPLDRRAALETAIKQLVPSATAPLPLSRTNCRTAVLAFKRSPSRAQECWLSPDSNLSLLEMVQASMAFPSSSSTFVPSPTSLNPASAALAYSRSLLDPSSSADQPIELVSLAIGYSLSSIPTQDPSKKRISQTRLQSLREIKQFGAGNSAAAEALSKRLEREGNESIRLERVEAEFDARELAVKEEVELRDSWSASSLRSGQTSLPLSPRSNSTPFLLSPPGSPSSFKSQPPPRSPSSTASLSSPRKRSLPLSFFSSRSASSSDLASSSQSDFLSSPPTLADRQRNMSLNINKALGEDEEEEEILGISRNDTDGLERRGLRSSISLGDLHSSFGTGGVYSGGIGAGREGSCVDLRM